MIFLSDVLTISTPYNNIHKLHFNDKNLFCLQTKGVNINGGFEEDSDDGYINKNSLPMGEITEDTVAGVLLGSKDFLSFGYQIASGMVSVCQVPVSLSILGGNQGHSPLQNIALDCKQFLSEVY